MFSGQCHLFVTWSLVQVYQTSYKKYAVLYCRPSIFGPCQVRLYRCTAVLEYIPRDACRDGASKSGQLWFSCTGGTILPSRHECSLQPVRLWTTEPFYHIYASAAGPILLPTYLPTYLPPYLPLLLITPDWPDIQTLLLILSKQKIFHYFMHMRAKTICGF